MPTKLLVADDEAQIRALVAKYARYEGYDIAEAADGMEAVALCRREAFDLVILDIMMPEMDGFTATREIRKFSRVPIILLSARGEEYDRINGFESGADDYVVKPFSPKELMLRVSAILSRAAGGSSPGQNEVFVVDTLRADVTARTVEIDGKRLDLSPKEYDLLFYLMRNAGVALSREKLITEVWGYDYYGDDRTLDTHIKLLRRSLGRYADRIVTLRGVGYRFDKDPATPS